MSFEDQLRDEFGRVDGQVTLARGSANAVKARARQRTRRARAASGAGVVAVVAVFGALAVQTGDSAPEKIETIDDSPAAEPTPDNTLVVETTVAPDSSDSNSSESNGDSISGDSNGDSISGESTSDGATEGDLEQGDNEAGLVTEADLTYLGAFRAPADVGDPGFGYGGRAAAFNPAGDPESSDDFDGSLFLSGFSRNELVAEISIPAPLLHDGSVADLPIAEVLQPLADVTGGRGSEFIGSEERGGLDDFRIGGLEVIDGPTGPRLHWTAWQYFNVGYNDVAGHGHSSLDLSDPDPQGPWYLGDFKTYATAGYLFSVPRSFADENLDGRSLLAGFQAGRPNASTSWGPPFFAFSPPPTAEPEARIDATELANYPLPDRQLAGYEEESLTPGADWLSTSDGRHAIVTAGNRRSLESTCSDDDGSNRDAFGPRLSFYDPADLASVARGLLDPSAVEPFRTWSPAEHLIPACGLQLSAISFDETNGHLYLVQVQADTDQREFEPVPVVHVFRLS